MEYTKLGNTDIEISKLCVGCMNFGKAGTSEEYLGRALKKHVARDKVVIASKVYFNPGRLSAEAIHREIDGTLKRLGTDYLDLYIIHRFDYETPIEETMEALHDLVKAGKVRALGASAMYGYQFYNMQLAAGHLTRPEWNTDTLRSKTDRAAMGKYDRTEEQDMEIVRRVAELAKRYGVKMQQIALAWEWAKGIALPIIGATKAAHFDDAAEAFRVKLSEEDIAFLEEPYVPHRIVGAIDHNPEDGVMLVDVKK